MLASEPGLRREAVRTSSSRTRRWALAALAGLALLLGLLGALASSLGETPVRRRLEQRANQQLDGYRIEIGEVDLRPLALGFDLVEVVITRREHPDLPVAQIGELTADVEWRALLRGALVADVTLDRPILYVDRRQARREARDGIPLHERGWQHALQAMIPLEINHLQLVDGQATYVDEGPFEPLRLTRIRGEAVDIRNVASRAREYPSELWLQARVFEAGRLELRGRADFLARPSPGVLAEVELEGIALDYFRPILERHHFQVRGGRLSLAGELELAHAFRRLRVRELVVNELAGDYVRTRVSKATEPVVARQTLRAAREAARRPELELRADRIELRDANIGMVNRDGSPAYRVFLSDLALRLENFSSEFSEGSGRARLTGRFMGSGATDARATFRAERAGPAFDLEVSIADTQLPALNDLLRAHGKLDVAAGLFSLYSEVHVENGRADGYVKPLFRDVAVHDPAQDRGDGVMRRAYEHLVGGVGELLENRTRHEIATQTDLSGPLDDPDLSTWQLLARLVENAFVRSILPGFDREAGQPRE
jgi:hypothetical protein